MSPRQPPQDPALAAAVTRLDRTIDWERRDRAKGMRVDTAPIRTLLAGLGLVKR